MEPQRPHILVVDDEQDLCEILQFNLEDAGYNVTTANSAEEALERIRPEHRLILLDVMMKGMSGFQMARNLRTNGNSIPIIFLTARCGENDMLTGFSTGADDYIQKPFSIKEVLARIKAVLRRGPNAVPEEADGLLLDIQAKRVSLDGKLLELTHKEYLILELLTQHPERFFSRTQILETVWRDEAIVLERTVDVHIARLRKKLGRLSACIMNKTGFGYSWSTTSMR